MQVAVYLAEVLAFIIVATALGTAGAGAVIPRIYMQNVSVHLKCSTRIVVVFFVSPSTATLMEISGLLHYHPQRRVSGESLCEGPGSNDNHQRH